MRLGNPNGNRIVVAQSTPDGYQTVAAILGTREVGSEQTSEQQSQVRSFK